MRKYTLIILGFILTSSVIAQNKYVYSTDLKNIRNDKLNIELIAPPIREKEILFSFPRVIPGSYSEKSFGKYVENFKAYNKKGKEIKVSKVQGEWLSKMLNQLSLQSEKLHTLQEVKDNYEATGLEDFELFWDNKPVSNLYKYGLLRL